MRRDEVFRDTFGIYRRFCSINPPFYILVDGSFICALIANGKYRISDLLRAQFEAPCKIFTTKCVKAALAEDFPGNAQIAVMLEQLEDLPCSHRCRRIVHPFSCILKISCLNHVKTPRGPPRKGKFVIIRQQAPFTVATQDPHLLEIINKKVLGVPLLHLEGQRLVIEKPGRLTLRWLQRKDHMRAEKFQVLKNIREQYFAAKHVGDDSSSSSDSSDDDKLERILTECAGTKPLSVKFSGKNGMARAEDHRRKEPSPDITDLRQSREQDIHKYKTILDKMCHVPKGLQLESFKPTLTMFEEFRLKLRQKSRKREDRR